MNLKEKHEELILKAKSLVDEKGKDMTDEDAAQVKSFLDEAEVIRIDIDKLSEKKSLVDQVKGLSEKIVTSTNADAPMAKSLGEHFVKSAAESLSHQSAGRRLDFSASEYKAASDPQLRPENLAEWGTEFSRSIVNQRREKLVVADLLGSASVTQPTIKYLVEKAETIAEGAPATVSEGAQKPYVRFNNFDIHTESLSKIAALTKLSDEMIADYGFVADWINNQLIYELSVEEERQLLLGDGTGSNLTGLLNRSGIQTTSGSVSYYDGFEAIYKAFDMVSSATPLTADGVVINPADYQALRLQKDQNQQYYAGGPFTGQYGQGGIMIDPPIWGRRTVVTQAIPKGTAIVGAFRQGATVLRKGGLRVDSTNTNANDFEHNLVTLRAEERLGLMVPLPAAFVKVELS